MRVMSHSSCLIENRMITSLIKTAGIASIAWLFLLVLPALADITTGLTLHYMLEDDSGTSAKDQSGAGRTGTLVNTPTWTTGQIGGGLNFAAASQESVTFTEFSRTNAEAWTFACWVKFTDTGSDHTLISGSTDPGNNTIRKTSNTNIIVRTQAFADMNFAVPALGTIWHHIAIVREAGDTVRLYIDGVASASNPQTDNGAMAFGRLANRNDAFWLNGDLDDVRIYTRALDAPDITELFAWPPIQTITINKGQTGVAWTNPTSDTDLDASDSTLELYYKLDDGSGTAPADSSTNANTGTAVNTPTWTEGWQGGGLKFTAADSEGVTYSDIAFGADDAWSFTCWLSPSDTAGSQGLAGSSGNSHIQKGTDTSIIIRTSTATDRTFTVASLGRSWHHLAVVREAGDALRVYVDGVASASNPISDGGTFTFNKLAQRNGDLYFNGLLDEVRVYSKALSAGEVARLVSWPYGTDEVTYSVIGGAQAANFSMYGTGMLVTAGSPLAPGTYRVDVRAKDTSGRARVDRISLVVNQALRGGSSPLGAVIQIPATPIRSKYAVDISTDLAWSTNTVDINPASYANWGAFLTANIPLTNKVFRFAEGDYTSWGILTLDDSDGDEGSGSPARRVVFKYNGDNASLPPWERPNDQATIQGISQRGAPYLLFHGLTVDPTGAAPSAHSITSDFFSDGMVFDWLWWPDTDRGGIFFRDFNHASAQFCRIERHTHQESSDRIGFVAGIWERGNRDYRVVGCTSINMTQLAQLTEQDAGGPGDQWTYFVEGGVIADSFGYCTDAYLALDVPADLHLEMGGIHKIAGSAEKYRHLVRGNVIYNYCQKQPNTGAQAGDGWDAMNFAKYIDIDDNIFFQCEKGCFLNAWPQIGEPNAQFENREIRIRRNLFQNIRAPATQVTTNDGWVLWTAVPCLIESNLFKDGDVSCGAAPGSGSNTWTGNTHTNMVDPTER